MMFCTKRCFFCAFAKKRGDEGGYEFSLEQMLEHGLKATIGKGPRSKKVRDSMVSNKGVYFAAVGGAAAGIASAVKKAEVIAYDDLGPEAIRRLVVERMPLFVVNDTQGNDLFEQGVAEYRRED